MASGYFNITYRQDHRLIQTRMRWFWLVVLAAGLLYLPQLLTTRSLFGMPLSNTLLLGMSLNQINVALIGLIAAVALNLLTGYTGLISVGSAGFFAVGAMVAAVLGVQNNLPFLLILVVAAVVGGVVGILVGLPSLRVRGLYLLLATLAFHYIAAFVFLQYQNAYFGEVGVIYRTAVLVGPLQLSDDIPWYFFLLALTVLTIIGAKNLLRTRQGRALVAIRNHDVAAGSAGINVPKVKIQVFALSSAVITVAGALYVWYLGNANADVFSLLLAIDFIAMIIIGGMGSINGAVFGALVWQLLPQMIDTLLMNVDSRTPVVGTVLAAHTAEVNMIVLGLVIILILIFKPEGLNGIWLSVKRAFTQWPYTS